MEVTISGKASVAIDVLSADDKRNVKAALDHIRAADKDWIEQNSELLPRGAGSHIYSLRVHGPLRILYSQLPNDSIMVLDVVPRERIEWLVAPNGSNA